MYSICIMYLTCNLVASNYMLMPHDSAHHSNSHIWFTENKGQWDNYVLYEDKFYGGKVFLHANEISYVFSPKEGMKALRHKAHKNNVADTSLTFHSIKMKFLNANPQPQLSPLDSNDFYENLHKSEEIVLDYSDHNTTDIDISNLESFSDNTEFLNFVLYNAEKTLKNLSTEELAKIGFGNLSDAIKEFSNYKN